MLATRGNIGFGKFQAPEVRSGRQKFQTYALASIGNISQINDSALLLFISDGIDDLHLSAEFHGFIQIDQATLGIYHDRLARLAEFVTLGIQAAYLHAHAPKYARTAALLVIR